MVVALNEPYAIFLGVKAEECVGQPIQDVICASRMPVVLATGEAELSSPHQYHDSKGLVDRIPIWYDGQIIGGIGFVLFKDIREIGKLLQENNLLAGKLSSYKATMGDFLRPKYSLEDIIGKSDSIKELKNTVRKIAPLRVDILINGETGVGKELWAHAIHCEEERMSGKKKPFVTVNCAAIPANLLESELFGYKEGAFTGAIRGGRLGKFQLADGGTIFLDEIGDMPLPMQAKILRVLQEREVESLGSSAGPEMYVNSTISLKGLLSKLMVISSQKRICQQKYSPWTG